jgi:hypothetical protein
MAMRLPVIVERNAWTLPQERYNTVWITEHQTGIVVPTFRNIAAAAATLLQDLPRYRCNTAATENRALFEVVDILKSILARAASSPSACLGAQSVSIST